MTTAMVGDIAPDFDLESTTACGSTDGRVRLDDYRGRWLVMVFYPRDFSLICPTELTTFSDRIDEFRGLGAEIVGISTDSVATHERWISTSKALGGLGCLAYPLASDPGGAISRAYGVYLEDRQVALRGLFIVDPDGILQYQVIHNLSVGRSSDEILRVLTAIQTGGLCAESFKTDTAQLIDPTEVLSPGRMISHYRIEEEIGAGSFSTVYRARDLTLDRDVALKIFKTTDHDRTKVVLKEARAAASLNHPNIGIVFGVDDVEGVSMIAMEYLDGRTLADYINEGPQDPLWVGRVARQVASGMAAAHKGGLVHGDLKPANIMVTNSGLVKILDFGLSRREPTTPTIDLDATIDAEEMESEGISGTPSYMSPEQADGETPTTASDVFAFGVIVHELLTGQKTFPGKNLLQVLNQIRQVDPDRIAADLPPPFDDLIRCTLARDPEDRSICMVEASSRLPEPAFPLVAAETGW